MAGFTLKVEPINEIEEIYICSAEGDNITNVEFEIVSLDVNALHHSDNFRTQIKIEGKISSENRNVTHKLVQWALDNDVNSLYRNIQLTVYRDKDCNGEVLRVYDLGSMFVFDYTENSSEGTDGNTKFNLLLAQKSGNTRNTNRRVHAE